MIFNAFLFLFATSLLLHKYYNQLLQQTIIKYEHLMCEIVEQSNRWDWKVNKIIGYRMSIYKNQGSRNQNQDSPYKKRLRQIAKMANYEPVASIPNINNDFNYTYAKQGHLKRKIKLPDVAMQSVAVEKSRKQSPPGSGRLPKIENKFAKIQYHPTNASENQQPLLTLDTRLETEEMLANSLIRSQPQSPLSKRGNSEGIKKVARIWVNAREKYARINETEEDIDEDQYSQEATPGPGSYSVCDPKSTFDTSKRSVMTDFSFGSKALRFLKTKVEPLPTPRIRRSSETSNPEQEQKQKMKYGGRKKKQVPFMSCSLKQQIPREKLPGPMDYYPRQSIEEELIRKIQRNFKGSFGNSEDRFKSDNSYSHLGPGYYNSPKEEENAKVQSFFFLSHKKRFE